MSHTRKGERLFRWALWWGIGIVVICLAFLLIGAFNESSTSDELSGPIMNTVYRLIYQFGIWPIVIYIGVVGPIFEEVCFRLWGDGKLWTGITSVILMTLWGLAIGWWLALLTALCGAAILIILRADKTKKLFALMLMSSVLFAVMHISNYDGNWFMMCVAVLHKVGMGLVASYLVINYNILWAMLFHILNNSILAIPLGIGFHEISTSQIVIDNDDFRLEIRPVLVDNDSILYDNIFFADTDTNYHFCSTALFAEQAMYYEAWQNGIDPSKDSLNIIPDYNYPKCTFNLVYKTHPYNHHGLIKALEGKKLIRIDTTYSKAYEMRIADSSLLSKIMVDSSYIAYSDVCYIARYSVDSLIFTNKQKPLSDSLYIHGLSYGDHLTLEELREILEPQGIVIEPSNRTMTTIEIHSTYEPLNELGL